MSLIADIADEAIENEVDYALSVIEDYAEALQSGESVYETISELRAALGFERDYLNDTYYEDEDLDEE